MTYRVEEITVEGEGLTLSRLIWNRFRAVSETTLAGIYDMNPEISEVGTFMPVGLVIRLPIYDKAESPEVKTVTLWG